MIRTLPHTLLVLVFLSAPALAQEKAPTKEPTIIDLSTALTRSVPSGKASIKILAEGQNAFVGQLWLAAGAQVPLHQDPTEEYIYVISGQGQMTINGKTTSVKAGSLVYMPAKAAVTFKNGNEPLIALQIFAGPESAKKYEKWPVQAKK